MKAANETEAHYSFRGRQWDHQVPTQAAAKALEGQGASALLSRVLAARGLQAPLYENYINSRLKTYLPDPFVMQDMEKGVQRMVTALRSGERVGVWSDYDVDGACAAAVFIRILRACGHHNVVLRIPDRITEGYGPNTTGLLAMQRDDACNLIYCLDAGIVGFEPLAAAKAAGIEMVVIDHHMPKADGSLPEGVAIINPNRLDDTSGLGHLCAAGVTFCFMLGVVRELVRGRYFDGIDGRPSERPEITAEIDLVALATVCDVMSQVGLNRAFIRAGNNVLSRRSNAGIAALAIAAGIDPADPIDEKTCGWVLGPRINAGGRIGQSDSGARLLIATDQEEITTRANALHQINVQRKELSDEVTQAAMAQMLGRVPGHERTLALAIVEEAHEGVVGISAGRLKEALLAPAIVLTRDHHGNLKGSARSVSDVDIGHIIQDAAAIGLILGGGGHGAAGGLTMRDDQVEGFVAFANSEIAKTSFHKEGLKLDVDLPIALRDLTIDAVRSLDQMRPFGRDNPAPQFILEKVVLEEVDVIKDKHLRITLSHGAQSITTMMWNAAEGHLGDAIQQSKGAMVDVTGVAEINVWNGNAKVQFIAVDIRLPYGLNLEASVEAASALHDPKLGLANNAGRVAKLSELGYGAAEEGGMTLITGLILDGWRTIKDKHLQVQFSEGDLLITGIKWNAAGGDFEKRVIAAHGMPVNALGDLEINEFRGRKTLQIKLKDFEIEQPALALDGPVV